jgi:hypothetical protein
VDVHVLDGNFLLPLPSIAQQCLGLGREGSQKFHGEISVAVLLGYCVRPLQTAQRGGLLGVPSQAALMRLLSRVFATPASVVSNASAKPAPSADEGWLIVSGWFGFDSTIKRGASGRLSHRLRYRSITARCCGWRGFRTIRGALWVGALTRLRFPIYWLSHSQGSLSCLERSERRKATAH